MITPASLPAPERRAPLALPAVLGALGEQLSRVPRRIAALVALLSLLAVGGAGVALAAAHPRPASSISSLMPRPAAPVVRPWEERRDRHGARPDPPILRSSHRDSFAPPRGP